MTKKELLEFVKLEYSKELEEDNEVVLNLHYCPYCDEYFFEDDVSYGIIEFERDAWNYIRESHYTYTDSYEAKVCPSCGDEIDSAHEVIIYKYEDGTYEIDG